MIHRHGDLERLVRDEAARWGWRATVRDLDLDIAATRARGVRVLAPGSGTIELIRTDGARIAIEYGLPEDEEDIRRTVHSALRGDEIETRRLAAATPDGPLVVGGF